MPKWKVQHIDVGGNITHEDVEADLLSNHGDWTDFELRGDGGILVLRLPSAKVKRIDLVTE